MPRLTVIQLVHQGNARQKLLGNPWWLSDPLLCAGSSGSRQTAFALSLVGGSTWTGAACHCWALGGIGEVMPAMLLLRAQN